MNRVLEFVLRQIDKEWEQVFSDLRALENLPADALLWQPAQHVHSIGWHFRHTLEWRYALMHLLIRKEKFREPLYCLGWENDLFIQKLTANPGEWFEPSISLAELIGFAEKIRAITTQEIRELAPARFADEMDFPWGKNRLLDEVLEEFVRHSAMHRGHARELKKAFVARDLQTGVGR